MNARSGLGALALLAGCRISALEGAEYVGPRNRCDICPADAQCAEDRCVAEHTAYPLTLDATPPTSSSYAPGVTFSVTIDDKRGGSRDLKLPETATVVAALDSGSEIPLLLRLQRVGAVPGSAAATFEAKSIAKATKTPPLSIPPGNYYVFVAPADEGTDLPPVQLRAEDKGPLIVTFAPGPQELRVAYAPASFRVVEVELHDNTKDGGVLLTSPRDARDVSVIDETSGRLASTIGHTCVPGMPLAKSVFLKLAPELAGHRYTLRVAPAAKACSSSTPPVRATVDFDLQALDVEGRGNKLVLQTPGDRTVLVSGLVRAFKESIAIEGVIVLRSLALEDDAPSGHAWSTVRVPINRDGTFRDIVLPGTYRADVIPSADVRFPSSDFAICVDCKVPSQDPMAPPGARSAEFKIDGTNALTFDEVARRVQIFGDAVGFDGALFTSGTWEASTSTSGALATLSGARLGTRAQSGLVSIFERTGEQWNIVGGRVSEKEAASLDPGVYDFVVRTPEASGYPWIVRPRMEVAASAKFDLGTMQASAPVVFTGRVVDPAGAPIARATIRARALIGETDPKKPALGAMLVGETRADENGNYRLVVPSNLNVPKPTD